MDHSGTITTECIVNEIPSRLHTAPGMPLPELLREQGLLSVRQGCRMDEYGICTMLADGTAVDSYLLPATWAEGEETRTPEDEAKDGKLSHV